MRKQFLNQNGQCWRCEMPLLATDLHCPFCGQGQIAWHLPFLHTAKMGVATLVAAAIGIPAALGAIGSVFLALACLSEALFGAAFICMLVCIACVASLRFMSVAFRKMTAR